MNEKWWLVTIEKWTGNRKFIVSENVVIREHPLDYAKRTQAVIRFAMPITREKYIEHV